MDDSIFINNKFIAGVSRTNNLKTRLKTNYGVCIMPNSVRINASCHNLKQLAPKPRLLKPVASKISNFNSKNLSNNKNSNNSNKSKLNSSERAC